MPTPKAGTVIPAGGDISAAVREFKAGKVEYRSEKGGTVHAGVGKMSFDENKLADNITAFVDQIRAVNGVPVLPLHTLPEGDRRRACRQPVSAGEPVPMAGR